MSLFRLGCIADDFTGATDLANNLARAGMRVSLIIGIPSTDWPRDADAVVVALKTRTIPVDHAVEQSLEACRKLRGLGANQIYFKICSTFDSTDRGNIGPVLTALMHELHSSFSVVAPAFPQNHRTVYQGHLFVAEKLLSESSMRYHPLTPMTDSNLLRLLSSQVQPHDCIGLIDEHAVADSANAIRARMHELETSGISIAIADCVHESDLVRLAGALYDAALVTASSGLGITLPSHWGFEPSAEITRLPAPRGKTVVLSGSCSAATYRQVRHFIDTGGIARRLDTFDLARDFRATVEATSAWAQDRWREHKDAPLLIYSTIANADLATAQQAPGTETAGALIEQAMGALARDLSVAGVGRLIVAGGETSGACVQALSIDQLRIGPQIDPGVPWCFAETPVADSGGLHVALKSGNFGADDFFNKALRILDAQAVERRAHA
ncbi:MAG: 3-oxo-tetronate kinase [Edaphobacter sp.]